MLADEIRAALETERAEQAERIRAIDLLLGASASSVETNGNGNGTHAAAGLGLSSSLRALLMERPGVTVRETTEALIRRGFETSATARNLPAMIHAELYRLKRDGRIKIKSGERLFWAGGPEGAQSNRGRPYAGIGFRPAVRLLLSRHPGLNAQEIAERLERGGVTIGGKATVMRRTWVELTQMIASGILRRDPQKRVFLAESAPVAAPVTKQPKAQPKAKAGKVRAKGHEAKAGSKGAVAFWSKFTPKQRSEELKRRARVRMANKKPKQPAAKSEAQPSA